MYYNEHNFYMGTIASFESCEIPQRPSDYVSYSGSTYWYDTDGVYRYSDHWGSGVSSCTWYLDDYVDSSYEYDDGWSCGFAKWGEFAQNDVYTVMVYGENLEQPYELTDDGLRYTIIYLDNTMMYDGYVMLDVENYGIIKKEFNPDVYMMCFLDRQ